MKQWLVYVFDAIGAILMILGAASVPENLMKWRSWLMPLDKPVVRWLLVGVGLIIIVGANLGPKTYDFLVARDTTQLAEDSIGLSKEISQFLADRVRHEPNLPRSESWEEDTAESHRYSRETISIYSERFAARAVSLYEKIKRTGFSDKELERVYKFPTNPIGMGIVAERLHVLSDILRDD